MADEERHPLKAEDIGTEKPYFVRAFDGIRRIKSQGLRRVRARDTRISPQTYYAAYEAGEGEAFDVEIDGAEVSSVKRVMVGKPCGIVKLKHEDGANDAQTFSVEKLRVARVRRR